MRLARSVGDVSVVDLLGSVDWRARMLADVRRGLLSSPKELPPKYFYDERGSRLFEMICELPEYYQTRTEGRLLERVAPRIVERFAPRALVEFGSGSSTKTRTILDAMSARGVLDHYAPLDLSREILVASAGAIATEYPGVGVTAVVADFESGLPALDLPSPALVIFLGGTIGNFDPEGAREFLDHVRGGMRNGDLFLIGFDTVKSPAVLNAAYNDAAGVTAEFNRNVLRVLNARLGAAFDPESFEHYAYYDPRDEQIEMHLVSTRDQAVAVPGLERPVAFHRGESVRTEISRKFTIASMRRTLEGAGFSVVEHWIEEGPAGAEFGVMLAAPSGASQRRDVE